MTVDSNFVVDLRSKGESPLDALGPLSLVDPTRCHHTERNLRLPLGIYNISISRVLSKLQLCCDRMETYWAAPTIEEAHQASDARDKLVDYIELLIYSAFEHVQDLEHLVHGFYAGKRDAIAEAFFTDLKAEKRFLATVANAVKHTQARVRLFSLQAQHARGKSCLHGFFVEGVRDGVVLPDPTLHEKFPTFSLSTLAWSVIVFLMRTSRSLSAFLNQAGVLLHGPAPSTNSKYFSDAFIAACRLPMFTFGEPFPLEGLSVKILLDGASAPRLTSSLYGSIHYPWNSLPGLRLTHYQSEYAGDGVTKTFNLFEPPTVEFKNWDAGAASVQGPTEKATSDF